MKKSFLKKFTLALAAVMVISSVPTYAASKPALNQKSKNLYLNNESVGKTFTFTVKNKVKGSTYKWTSSNTTVASVSDGKVTGKKIGAATITCKITLPTKKTQTLTAKVNVKANATAVAISNPVESMGIGEKVYDFNRTMTVKNATDKTAWIIDADTNTAGATIDSKGVVSTKTAGEFRLSARTYQSKAEYAKGNYTSESDQLIIQVVSGMLKAEQTHANKVDVTFDADMKDTITTDNISIVNKTTKAKLYLKDISFSADGKTASIEAYQDFDNNNVYQIEYNKNTVEFAVKTGAVDRIVLKPEAIQYSTPKQLTVTLYSNDIDVTDKYIDKVSITTDNGYASGRELTLFSVGDTAKVKAVYHSGTYNSSGDEIIVESPIVVFKAVQEIDVVGTFSAYTIIESGTQPDWNKVNHTIPAGKENMKMVTKGTDSAGKELISLDSTDVKFQSSDTSILIMSEDGSIYPIKDGIAYVKVTYGKTVQVYSVTVAKESVTAALTIDKQNVVLSNYINDSVTVKVSTTDQYGNATTPTNLDYPTLLTSPKNAALNVTPSTDGKFIFSTNGSATTAGVYTYKIEANGKAAVLTITVKSPNFDKNNVVIQGPVQLDLDVKTLDVGVDSKNPVDKFIAIAAYKTSTNGVKTEILNLSNYSVKIYNPNGKEISDPNLTSADYSGVFKNDSFYGLSISGSAAQQAKAGTYKIELRELSNKLITATTFTVTNSTKKPGYSVKKYEVKDVYSVLTAAEEAFTVTSGTITNVTFTKLGDKIDATTGLISAGAGTYSVYIKSIIISETINGITLDHTVSVEKPITIINQ